MCIYIHIYICIYICIYMYIHMYTNIRIYFCMYALVGKYIYIGNTMQGHGGGTGVRNDLRTCVGTVVLNPQRTTKN